MTRIEPKDAFAIVSYIKSIFPFLNKKENNDLEIIFSNNEAFFFSGYFLFSAKLIGKNTLVDWGSKKNYAISLENLKDISKCLKKNLLSVEYDESKFSFKFLKDKQEEEIILENKENLLPLEKKEKKEEIEKLLTKKETLPEEKLEEEIFELFLDETGNITNKKTEEKILEIPSKRIISILKKPVEFFIEFSEKKNGFRYVSIGSKDENLELKEFFAAI